MDKIFLIDTNQITYQQLIDYVNGDETGSYSVMELFFLNTIKGLVIGKIKDGHFLVKTVDSYIEIFEINSNLKLKIGNKLT